jgi:hypothetical protein
MQCPNDGGYRTHEWATDYLHPHSMQRAEPRGFWWPLAVILFLSIFFLVPFSVFLDLATGSADGVVDRKVGTWAAVAVGGVWAATVLTIVAREARKLPQHKLMAVHHFECAICGYRWSWADGEPLPPVTVRPDLISKGSQRLQEEEDWWQRFG